MKADAEITSSQRKHLKPISGFLSKVDCFDYNKIDKWGVSRTVKITIVRWMLLVSFVLCFGCGEGMNVKGEGSLDDDATDDDVIPSEPPPPPVNCDWARGNEAIILMWQHQDLNMVDSFIIERWERELSQWKIIAEPKPNPEVVIQQYTDDSALCDVSYTYRIYASNSAGKSKKSCAVGNAIWNCPNR